MFVLPFHQILHSNISVLIVIRKHGAQKPIGAQFLCEFGTIVAWSACSPGHGTGAMSLTGTRGFTQLLWLSETWNGGK